MRYPSYLNLYESGELRERVEKAKEMLLSCRVCPHNCEVNRLENELGYCKTGRYAVVSSYFPHRGEEFPIRGYRGSGTIFFSYCNMRCVYCQNYEISHFGEGREAKPEELADMMLELQDMGCHNINLVSPSHVVPQILEALLIAVEKGLRIPLVYNTSSFDSLESLKLLDGIVDIYLADLKYLSREFGRKYSKVKDYPKHAKEAIREFYRQVRNLKTDERGIAVSGLIVRHLVLPNDISTTKEVMDFLRSIDPELAVNVMDQYFPFYRAKEYPELARRVSREEYERALEKAHGLTLIND
ncbi:putative pyruvate formate lyase activating enzyme [Hydrogenivirga caldilitoris]|uniref:Putative pyruvate formate lyase activating enzyme n=1 Tax=Hydrogenivirga caldilitoris TaxID=246264 RepID=A0A497XPV4_9AQUI|nr:radical SAM protein [Hydrogenivirga caldilitoris]RLJ70180.1 putative pyruvate formate lyase activating enzyme [Hydrogenivirga caldilitoris]